MTITQEFFYDEQIRRFLLQFTRAVSGFQVEYGRDKDDPNKMALLRVPVRYGDATRNAQTIIQENSANNLPSTPLMTFYITSLTYDRQRLQEPYHVNKVSVRQRTYDSATETYETTQGNAFTVERLMPVPYKMSINLDIWTSNTNQKWQIWEQLSALFNPSLEVQSTDNFLDWTSLSVIELDDTVYTSRTIPIGTDNPIDIATWKFNIPIWLSSPVKVKKLGVVERVVMSMYDAQGDFNDAITNNDLLLGTRVMVTPWNYKLVVIDNTIQILYDPAIVPNGSLADLEPTSIVADSPLLWPAVIGAYGVLRPGISQIRLNLPPENPDTQIVGTIVIEVVYQSVTLDQARDLIVGAQGTRRRGYVCCGTAYGLVEAGRDPELRRAFNGSWFTTPDGMPLVWLGPAGVERVYGPDLMLAVCDAGRAVGLTHFFLGGAEGVERWAEEYAAASTIPRLLYLRTRKV